MKKLVCCTILLSTVTLLRAETFTIAGFAFDQASSVKTAAIVEGHGTLEHRSNKHFGRFSEDYLRTPEITVNEFMRFDRSKTMGHLLGSSVAGKTARHINFQAAPGTRVSLELTWGTQGLPNKSGADFYIFESGETGRVDAFSIAVRKAGSSEFTPFRFKRSARHDKLHLAHATALDLSEFGFTEGDICSAIRIRNVRGSNTKAGADRVDNESGEGLIVAATHPDYKNAFPLRIRAGGTEPAIDELDPDIIYVVGRYSLVPLDQTGLVATTPVSRVSE